MPFHAAYVTRLVAIGVILLSATFFFLKAHKLIDNVLRPSSQQAWTQAMFSEMAIRGEKGGRHDEAVRLFKVAQQHAKRTARVEQRVEALASIGRLQFQHGDGPARLKPSRPRGTQ
jgi:hypothetical protein